MVPAPGIEIQGVIDRISIRKGQCIQIRYRQSRRSTDDPATLVFEDDPRQAVKPLGIGTGARREELRERSLAFANDDDIRSGA